MTLLYCKAKWRLFNTATIPCGGLAPISTFDDVMPSSRSLFHLGLVFLVVSARYPSRHATSKLDDPPQQRNISCNAKQFNVELERLMFCKAIRRYAIPFVCTLYHSTLRWAISRNATLFVCTLYHSTLRWAISRNTTPFVRTLCYSTLPWVISSNATPFGMCTVLFDIALSHFRMTQRYTVCLYTVPFDITLRHLTQRCSICVLYCKWVLNYSQLS